MIPSSQSTERPRSHVKRFISVIVSQPKEAVSKVTDTASLHSFGSLAKTYGLSNTIRRIFGSPVKYDTMSIKGAPVFHPTDAKCHD